MIGRHCLSCWMLVSVECWGQFSRFRRGYQFAASFRWFVACVSGDRRFVCPLLWLSVSLGYFGLLVLSPSLFDSASLVGSLFHPV